MRGTVAIGTGNRSTLGSCCRARRRGGRGVPRAPCGCEPPDVMFVSNLALSDHPHAGHESVGGCSSLSHVHVHTETPSQTQASSSNVQGNDHSLKVVFILLSTLIAPCCSLYKSAFVVALGHCLSATLHGAW